MNVSSTIEFNIQMFNCIERKRYDLATFDTQDSTIQGLYGKALLYDTSGLAVTGDEELSNAQPSFGMKIPMYLVPYSNKTSTSTETPITQESFIDTRLFNEDGSVKLSGSTCASARKWVHTGVHVGDVNPQPGGKDFDSRPVNETERKMIQTSKSDLLNSGNAALDGSGYRRGAMVYAYSIDLIFEIST
ncbi:MAG: hypothetical protein ACXWVU_00750 [Sulfuricurvum sp.]